MISSTALTVFGTITGVLSLACFLAAHYVGGKEADAKVTSATSADAIESSLLQAETARFWKAVDERDFDAVDDFVVGPHKLLITDSDIRRIAALVEDERCPDSLGANILLYLLNQDPKAPARSGDMDGMMGRWFRAVAFRWKINEDTLMPVIYGQLDRFFRTRDSETFEALVASFVIMPEDYFESWPYHGYRIALRRQSESDLTVLLETISKINGGSDDTTRFHDLVEGALAEKWHNNSVGLGEQVGGGQPDTR